MKEEQKRRLGFLPCIYMGNPEILVGKTNGSRYFVSGASWAVILGDAIFLLCLVCLADLNILCNGSFSHLVKFNFYSFMFMHKISTRVVYVNGNPQSGDEIRQNTKKMSREMGTKKTKTDA